MNAPLNYDIIEGTLFIFTSVGMLFPHGIQVGLNKCNKDTWQGVIGKFAILHQNREPFNYIF